MNVFIFLCILQLLSVEYAEKLLKLLSVRFTNHAGIIARLNFRFGKKQFRFFSFDSFRGLERISYEKFKFGLWFFLFAKKLLALHLQHLLFKDVAFVLVMFFLYKLDSLFQGDFFGLYFGHGVFKRCRIMYRLNILG